MKPPIPIEEISQQIVFIRGQRVILDEVLAQLYQVETKVLNQAVRRYRESFPEDFMFQLTEAEFLVLSSQIVTLDKGRGKYRKYLPFAFTEQGVAMRSGVLKSKTAIEVNIAIMRVFVRLRRTLESNNEEANHPAGPGLGNIVLIAILAAYAGKAVAPLRFRSRPTG
jgi:predicted AAA+ superfamily ATPase